MAVIQTFNRSENTVVELSPSNGSNIVEVFDANPRRLTQKLGLTAQYTTVNSFIKSFDLYTEINSCEEVEMPDFKLTDSSTDKTRKAIDVNWNSARKELIVWDQVNGSPWRKLCIVALHNPNGYPYRIYHLKDELTDSLYFEVGSNYKLGVSIQNVGFGGLLDGDIAVVRITGTSEVVVINPSTEVFKDILVNRPNTVTDENIGARTLDDRMFLGSQPNATLTVALSSLAYQIRQIIGEDSWREVPNVDLKTLQSSVDQIKSDLAALVQLTIFKNGLEEILDTEWQNIPLTLNWTNCIEFGTFPPQFRLLKDGSVEIRGAVKALSSPPYLDHIGTLPVEASPQATVYIRGYGNELNRIVIDPLGNICWEYGDAFAGLLLDTRFARKR